MRYMLSIMSFATLTIMNTIAYGETIEFEVPKSTVSPYTSAPFDPNVVGLHIGDTKKKTYDILKAAGYSEAGEFKREMSISVTRDGVAKNFFSNKYAEGVFWKKDGGKEYWEDSIELFFTSPYSGEVLYKATRRIYYSHQDYRMKPDGFLSDVVGKYGAPNQSTRGKFCWAWQDAKPNNGACVAYEPNIYSSNNHTDVTVLHWASLEGGKLADIFFEMHGNKVSQADKINFKAAVDRYIEANPALFKQNKLGVPKL